MSDHPEAKSLSFAELGLGDALLRAIDDLGYEVPTPIQQAAIPAILKGRDVWASAKTGSGKSAAFLLPLLHRLSAQRRQSPRPLRVLILVPTRELAAQMVEAIRNYGCRFTDPLKTCLAIGGVSINPQMMALRGGADVVVATPGRLLDLVEHNAVRLSAVETLVLDEADRLLALGFSEEISRIIEQLPPMRQTLLFSATFPPAVQEIVQRVLREPVEINVDAGRIPDTALIQHRAIEVDADRRTMLLRQLLTTHDWTHVLVFVATKYGADHVAMKLDRAGITVGSLHGELSQGARTQALADFKARKIRVLIATDVAARGIDIEELPAVVNYDLPRSPVDYLHRVGRTGRAGGSGVAISFVSAETDAHFRVIERKNRLAIEREQIPGFEPQILEVPKLDPNGGVKGRRKSKKDRLREAAGQAPSRSPAAAPKPTVDAKTTVSAKTEPMFPYTPRGRGER